MPMDNPQGGFSFSPEYQSSALPWLTSSQAPAASPQEIDFNFVTRFITVLAVNSMSVAVTYSGSLGGNRVVVPTGVPVTFEWRVGKIFVKSETGSPASYSLAVGLTTVPVRNMPLISGSYADGSAGWAGVG